MDYMELFKVLYAAADLPSKDRSCFWHQALSPAVKSFVSNDKTGKWCVMLTATEVDAAWAKIKAAVETNRLLCAKAATRLSSERHGGSFVICVYTADWSDEADLHQSRAVLRELGFEQPLRYKRDIETINNVYGTEDEWYLTQ